MDDFDTIISSFRSEYGVSIRSDEFKTMPWSEFVSLLSGLGPNTSLARLVEIRLEDDKDILKNFTPSQHRIRNQWRYRKTKEVTQEDVGTFLEQMKQTFISMSK
ncbi:MAG: Gp15 family bacteriophage protein [Ruminococcus sp.]